MLGFSWDDQQDDDYNRARPGQPSPQPPDALGATSALNGVTPPAPPMSFATPGLQPQGGDAFQPRSAGQPSGGGFESSLGSMATPMGASSPTPPASPAGPESAKLQATKGYQDTLAKIKQTQDPQQQAVLKDSLARTLFSSLKTAGHDVKWDGDNLVVDGRPYVVGGGTGNTGVMGAPGQVAAGRAQMAGGGLTKDTFLSTAQRYPHTVAGLQQMMAENPEMFAGVERFGSKGEKLRLPNGQVIDSIANVGRGGTGWQWHDTANDAANAVVQRAPAVGISAPGAAGVPVNDGSDPNFPSPANNWGGAGAAHPYAMAAAAEAANPQAQGFQTTAPIYTPGDVGLDDLPGLSYEQLLEDAGSFDPNGAGGVTDGATEDLVMSLLRDPSALSDRMVDTLKAKSKDELAELAEGEEQELLRFGQAYGIGDSPWLASERLSGDRARNAALVGSNRDIDIRAAETRAGDRRAAAELGASFSNQKATRSLAAADSKQRAVALAADTSLRAAALQSDRLALRESINQKAAELGQSADRIQLDFTMGLLDDATRRYGIDIGAQLDREKLAQMGREFHEELAYKLAALDQADDQFGASYGLNAARLQHDMDQDHYERYRDTLGLDA